STVIDDGDEVARILTVLIHTEPPPMADDQRKAPHFKMSMTAGERDLPQALIEKLTVTHNRRRGEYYLDVLELLANGFRRQEAAEALGLSLEGVKSHLKRAQRELGSNSPLHS